jgi:hypothetical protein
MFKNPRGRGEEKMFWRRKQVKEGEAKLPRPKGIPNPVGAYMVVNMKKDPNWVLNLKAVLRPTDKKKAFYCRVFDVAQTGNANVKVENWTSLDGHPELIVWEGYVDEGTNIARSEKFVKTT